MKEKLVKIAKGTMALLSVALLTMIATKMVDSLYDIRLVVAAAGGAFGYEPLVKLFSKIKGLE